MAACANHACNTLRISIAGYALAPLQGGGDVSVSSRSSSPASSPSAFTGSVSLKRKRNGSIRPNVDSTGHFLGVIPGAATDRRFRGTRHQPGTIIVRQFRTSPSISSWRTGGGDPLWRGRRTPGFFMDRSEPRQHEAGMAGLAPAGLHAPPPAGSAGFHGRGGSTTRSGRVLSISGAHSTGSTARTSRIRSARRSPPAASA